MVLLPPPVPSEDPSISPKPERKAESPSAAAGFAPLAGKPGRRAGAGPVVGCRQPHPGPVLAAMAPAADGHGTKPNDKEGEKKKNKPRGRAVTDSLPASPTGVRYHPPPPKKKK